MSVLKIVINLKNLRENYYLLQQKTSHISAVVKADAYGLGAELIVSELIQLGCHIFFVANADEGVALREKFPDIIIYIFDGYIEKEKIKKYHLRPVLNTIEQLKEFLQDNIECSAALHIDTGMNRLGIPHWESNMIILSSKERKKIDFIMSHYSDSDSNPYFTNHQYDLLITCAKKIGINTISIANSCGHLLYSPNPHFITRTGTALYGGVHHDSIKPVVSLIGSILQKKIIPANEPVGYGQAFTTHKPTKIITAAGGYADGILRAISHNGFKGDVMGYKIPLIGRVSMDTCLFDATDLPKDIYHKSVELEYYGGENSVFHMAECANTISYEIFTQMSRRAERIILR